MNIRVTFLIPCRSLLRSPYIPSLIDAMKAMHLREQSEIIFLPDFEETLSVDSTELIVRVVPTGPIPPGRKRDKGAAVARGEILCFIDDDARPAPDYVERLLPYFDDPTIVAVGGPNITPPEDNFLKKTSGDVFASWFGGGMLSVRYRSFMEKKGERYDDWPSCNVALRASFYRSIGGFDTDYWPGEDTILARKVVRATQAFVYAPDVIVYHHRREFPFEHLQQVIRYGKMRAFFAKRYPENSRKLHYFLPMFFVLFVLTVPLAVLFPVLSPFYMFVFGVYGLLTILFSIAQGNPLLLLAFPLTHLTYGIGLCMGLVATEKSMH